MYHCTMIDTHAHLYLEDYDQDLEEVISRIRAARISRIYLPNIDADHILSMKERVSTYPDLFYPMMGLHPCSVKPDSYVEELNAVRKELSEHPGYYHAVGEIGIDLYWDKTTRDIQEQAYRLQIEWAIEYNLPIVIHSRDSLDLTISVIEDMKVDGLTGIFHCFNGTIEQAHRIMELGFLMGIGGVVTFKNAGVDKVVAQLPLTSLVLETDAPYLTPVPFRGKRNESSYLTYIADKIAEVKDVNVEEVIDKTTRNALELFGS